jgi:hypothetical protein
MDLHALLGAQAPSGAPALIPGALRELADEYRLGSETVQMLATIHIDGRQPSSREDWLFLLLAIRRSCHILEPLAAHSAVGEKGDKHALRS